MKKLLALVLCVVMVLSLAPSAFAATTVKTNTAKKPAEGTNGWASVADSKTAISNAKKDIEYVYGTLAADTAVFGSIQAADSIITDLAKGIFADIDDYSFVRTTYDTATPTKVKVTLSNSTLVNNTKDVLRDIVGSSVTKYLNKHINEFATVGSYTSTDKKGTKALSDTGYTTKDGYAIYSNGDNFFIYDPAAQTWKYAAATETITALAKAKAATKFTNNQATVYKNEYYKYDPIKYANTYAAAMSDAFSSEKGAKGIEALVYALYYANASKEVSDKMDDLKDEIIAWEGVNEVALADYGFNESWNPYSFLNPSKAPKSISVPAGIFATDATSTIAGISVDPWY